MRSQAVFSAACCLLAGSVSASPIVKKQLLGRQISMTVPAGMAPAGMAPAAAGMAPAVAPMSPDMAPAGMAPAAAGMAPAAAGMAPAAAPMAPDMAPAGMAPAAAGMAPAAGMVPAAAPMSPDMAPAAAGMAPAAAPMAPAGMAPAAAPMAPAAAAPMAPAAAPMAPAAAPMAAAPMVATGPIYPQKAPGDAPYSTPEATLKAAIKLPSGFTMGKKMPVILAPGTGVTGTQTYTGNFMKLLADNPTMEPVVLDIPNNLLDDVQTNAEFLAYGINSVSKMANGMNVSVVTWSQGSLDMQWAVKYWPSTRPIVSDFVAISPDLAGTTVASAASGLQGILPIAPSLLQQESTSMLVATLRSNGGDSAIVPTTTIYSSSDQVVTPQTGNTASGFFKSANGVPAANYQVQTVCPNAPAGGDFKHEGVLYNSFAFAIAMDAMSNPGPGDVKRLDIQKVCSTALAPGLTAADKTTTDNTISEAAGNILKYETNGKTTAKEPPIKAYAKKDMPAAAGGKKAKGGKN